MFLPRNCYKEQKNVGVKTRNLKRENPGKSSDSSFREYTGDVVGKNRKCRLWLCYVNYQKILVDYQKRKAKGKPTDGRATR